MRRFSILPGRPTADASFTPLHRSDEHPLELYMRDERTTEVRKLGSFPAIPRKLSWAPDGQSLLLPHMSGQSSALFRYWLNDGRKELLIRAKPRMPLPKAYPKLSPDGKTLFYLEGPFP